MPKRTNEFQKLVYLVQKNLGEGAKVTESKFLTSRLTKPKRMQHEQGFGAKAKMA